MISYSRAGQTAKALAIVLPAAVVVRLGMRVRMCSAFIGALLASLRLRFSHPRPCAAMVREA